MAALGLHCSGRAFSSCCEQGLLSGCGAGAPHCGGLSSWTTGSRVYLISCCCTGAQAELPCSMWDLPEPGIEAVSTALAGGFLATGPPGKSNLPLELRRKAGHCSRVTAGPIDLI